jgi:hypothetical protein
LILARQSSTYSDNLLTALGRDLGLLLNADAGIHPALRGVTGSRNKLRVILLNGLNRIGKHLSNLKDSDTPSQHVTGEGVAEAVGRTFDACSFAEIWLAVRQQGRMFLVEQTACPDDVEVLGEVITRFINDEFVADIVPLQQRSADELTKMAQQAERHRQYRQECYGQFSLEERIRNLTGAE